jgi:succinyl-CoA synthetase beta subunit
MVRGSLGKLASRALSVAGKWQHQQLRRLNIHEYQGAELMGKYGINVPRGAAAGSVEEVKNTLKNVFPSEKEVMFPFLILYCLCGQFETWLWQLFDGIRMYIENVVYCNFC